jgi:hypothetical protein
VSLGRFRALVVVVAVLTVTFGHLLGPFDFLTFFRAGRHVLAGASPYPQVTSAVFRSGHGFVYPLFVAWLFAPLALIPRIPAEVVYGLASVGAIVGSCRMLGRRDFGAAVLVLVCSTTIIGLQMGTVNAFLLLGLACSWYWRSSHPLLSGVALGLAAAAKLFLVPVLLWPLLVRRWTTAGAAMASAAVAVVSGSLLGTEGPVGYFHLLSHLQANEQVSSWSLSSLFQALGVGRSGASAAAVVVVGTGLVVLWRRRAGLREEQVMGAMVVFSLFVSPIVWSSYLLLLAVPLLLLDRHDLILAGAAVASWVVVTPDAASALRVGIGVLLALVVAYGTGRHHLGALGRWVRAQPGWLAVVAASAVVLVALPDQVRSPLPALAAVALVGVRCLRPARAAQAV